METPISAFLALEQLNVREVSSWIKTEKKKAALATTQIGSGKK
jgi:hypothetical protein